LGQAYDRDLVFCGRFAPGFDDVKLVFVVEEIEALSQINLVEGQVLTCVLFLVPKQISNEPVSDPVDGVTFASAGLTVGENRDLRLFLGKKIFLQVLPG
jgi:hypothetical protein